ncbi:MAG TPA: hypothetical protein VE690_03100 [Rhodopila sp.]|nr:hypothetical protein [Rhodopila sp.]
MTVPIAGGSTSRLTPALSLDQVGAACRAFETVVRPQALGVGCNLLPDVVRELVELGLRPPLGGIGD